MWCIKHATVGTMAPMHHNYSCYFSRPNWCVLLTVKMCIASSTAISLGQTNECHSHVSHPGCHFFRANWWMSITLKMCITSRTTFSMENWYMSLTLNMYISSITAVSLGQTDECHSYWTHASHQELLFLKGKLINITLKLNMCLTRTAISLSQTDEYHWHWIRVSLHQLLFL